MGALWEELVQIVNLKRVQNERRIVEMNNKQINIILVLITVFVVWLFYNTYAESKSKREVNTTDYEFYNSEKMHPIILDKSTGETWRYFRKLKPDGVEISKMGWTQLYYHPGNGEWKGATPHLLDVEYRKVKKIN